MTGAFPERWGLQRPESSLRVIAVEVGAPEQLGAGTVQINPWLEPAKLNGKIECTDDAENLASYGLPLSLAQALEWQMQPAVQIGLLSLLHALVQGTPCACDQLNEHQKVPLKLSLPPQKEAASLVAKVESVCKRRLADIGHHVSCKDWTEFGSTYEVWLCCGTGQKLKLRLRGERKDASSFDFGGVHMTGGRIWAGSLLLARWAASLHFAEDARCCMQRLCWGPGPVLELGAGLGLAGISLAKLGQRVVLIEREPVLLDRLKENVTLNCVENKCRVLSLDWAQVGEPKMRRLLQAQKFSAVIGSDVVYEECHTDLLVNVLQCVLPNGGFALLVNAARHRKGIQVFGQKLRQAGHEVIEKKITCDSVLQDLICGKFEPCQEYVAYIVHIAAT